MIHNFINLAKWNALPKAYQSIIKTASHMTTDWMVAKYYYYPGWWEGCTQSGFFISVKEWEKLPPGYRAAINAVASEVMNWSLAKYDSGSPGALRRLSMTNR